MHDCTSIASALSFRTLRLLGAACAALLLFISSAATAQIEDPVDWEFGLYPSEQAGMHDLVVHATVDSCWHIYSQDNDPNNGPVPTYFEFEWPAGVTPQGSVDECTPLEEYDPNFMMDLKFFEEEVYWRQTVDLSGAQAGDSLKGFVLFLSLIHI